MQRRLYTLYYISKGVIDGSIGAKTEAAIREFQANNRLEETGVADEATQRALFSATAIAKNTKYKLVVSINDQRVYVYGLNSFGEYELDDTFICSTGLGDSTPTGIYTTSTEPLTAGSISRSSSAGRSTPSASPAISGSIRCSTARRTRAPCATALSPPWAERPSHAACACAWKTPSGSMRTATRAPSWSCSKKTRSGGQ